MATASATPQKSKTVGRRPRYLAGTALAFAALAGAACSANPKSPSVAHLGTTTSTTVAGPDASKGDAFSACMRSHGVPLFPDPDSSGAISPGAGVDPNGALFQKATEACRPLQSAGGGQTSGGGAPLTPAQQEQFLKYAQCMRAHGISNFPDPGSRGIALEPTMVPDSPQFQTAHQACKSLLPDGGAGKKVTAGGRP